MILLCSESKVMLYEPNFRFPEHGYAKTLNRVQMPLSAVFQRAPLVSLVW